VTDRFDPSRLAEQLRLDRQGLEYPRARREQMVRALAGPDRSEETSAGLSEPVNLLDLYVKAITPNLIAQGPRVLPSTFDADAKPAVAAMERSSACAWSAPAGAVKATRVLSRER
jgi:hypothetical protein